MWRPRSSALGVGDGVGVGVGLAVEVGVFVEVAASVAVEVDVDVAVEVAVDVVVAVGVAVGVAVDVAVAVCVGIGVWVTVGDLVGRGRDGVAVGGCAGRVGVGSTSAPIEGSSSTRLGPKTHRLSKIAVATSKQKREPVLRSRRVNPYPLVHIA